MFTYLVTRTALPVDTTARIWTTVSRLFCDNQHSLFILILRQCFVILTLTLGSTFWVNSPYFQPFAVPASILYLLIILLSVLICCVFISGRCLLFNVTFRSVMLEISIAHLTSKMWEPHCVISLLRNHVLFTSNRITETSFIKKYVLSVK